MLHEIKLAFPEGLHSYLDEVWYVSTWETDTGPHIGQFTKLPEWGESKK